MRYTDIIEVQRRITAMQFPVEHTEHLVISDADDRDGTISNVTALWLMMSHRLIAGEPLGQDLDFIRLMVSTHAVRSVFLIHKLRADNRLLVELEFAFTYECAPMPYRPELEKFLRAWPMRLRGGHPTVDATLAFGGVNQEHPYLIDYEGHDASPSLLVTSTTSARRFTTMPEEEES